MKLAYEIERGYVYIYTITFGDYPPVKTFLVRVPIEDWLKIAEHI